MKEVWQHAHQIAQRHFFVICPLALASGDPTLSRSFLCRQCALSTLDPELKGLSGGGQAVLVPLVLSLFRKSRRLLCL